MNKNKDENKKTPPGEFFIADTNAISQPGFFDALMKFQYGEGEESDKGFEEMARITQGNKLENLFEQTRDLQGPLGPRLSGEPEIVHEIEDHFRQVEFYPIVRDQVKKILEFVPSVFLENWKSPEGYEELNPQQQEAYKEIIKSGLQACPGPVIQKVIELAVDYRDKYTQP